MKKDNGVVVLLLIVPGDDNRESANGSSGLRPSRAYDTGWDRIFGAKKSENVLN